VTPLHAGRAVAANDDDLPPTAAATGASAFSAVSPPTRAATSSRTSPRRCRWRLSSRCSALPTATAGELRAWMDQSLDAALSPVCRGRGTLRARAHEQRSRIRERAVLGAV